MPIWHKPIIQNKMVELKFKIGDEVVRSKGDYVVGRVGIVVAIDEVKLRAQVDCGIKTWVSFNSLELTSIPYEIIPAYQKSKSVFTNPKYKRLG